MDNFDLFLPRLDRLYFSTPNYKQTKHGIVAYTHIKGDFWGTVIVVEGKETKEKKIPHFLWKMI